MGATTSSWFVYIFTLLPHVVCYVQSNTRLLRRRQQRKLSFLQSLQRQNDEQQTKIIVPIFPLSKRVKLPTESIQLRLWEPRYLQLVDFMRNQIPRLDYFGSVFSYKPQFVGNTVITPILAPGDVGVLCHVLQYQDSVERYTLKDVKSVEEEECNVTSELDEKLGTRRIIQLDCIASTRFRIEKILQSGFGDSPHALPFILVEACTFHDIDENSLDMEATETSSIIRRLETLSSNPAWNDYIQQYKNHEKVMDLERLSFYLLSSVSSKLSTRETLRLLSTTSSKERLLFLEKMNRFSL